MEALKKVQWNSPRTIVIVSSVVLVVVLLIVLVRKPSQTPPGANANLSQSSAAVYCDGSDWSRIDMMNLTQLEKIELRGGLLKAILESSALNGKPLSTFTSPFTEYIKFVDIFYQNKDNHSIPVYFAFMMADMSAKGQPANAVEAYKAVILQKLKSAGMVQ